jgi:hypothetical protein
VEKATTKKAAYERKWDESWDESEALLHVRKSKKAALPAAAAALA